MTPLPDRDRRTAGVGLTVVACVLVLGRGGPAWWRWVSEHRAAAGALQAEVARGRAVLRDAPARRDSARVWERRAHAAQATLLASVSPATTGTALAEQVGDLATAAGVRLGPVELRAPTPLPVAPLPSAPPLAATPGGAPAAGGTCAGTGTCAVRFLHVTARTDVTGDVHGLASFLAALEQSNGRLAVRELTVTQPEPGAPPTRAEVLHATLVVEALATTAGGAPPPVGPPASGGGRGP